VVEKLSCTKEEIILDLAQYIGTENYYRYGRYVYTDGIQRMAELCGAYWLIGAVISHQQSTVKDAYFQVWSLEKMKSTTDASEYWLLRMRVDIDKPYMVCQTIEYSDFPLDFFEFYLIDGVLLLVGEY
jgi:hypothetical protein